MSELCKGNCENCPAVRVVDAQYDELTKDANQIGEMGMSEEVDTILAPAAYEMLQENGGRVLSINADDRIELVEPSSPEEVAESTRLATASFLRFLDKQRENGKTVTTTVCMSPKAPQGNSVEHVKVHRA